MQQSVLWILLADGGSARIIERVGPFGPLDEIQSLTHAHESTSKHGTDRPGRGFESSGAKRHAYEPHTDWHEKQKDEFAKEIVNILNTAHLSKKFDELYVIAPPKMLGLLRQHIDQTNHHIGSKISKSISKDAISFTLRELENYIDNL